MMHAYMHRQTSPTCIEAQNTIVQCSMQAGREHSILQMNAVF